MVPCEQTKIIDSLSAMLQTACVLEQSYDQRSLTERGNSVTYISRDLVPSHICSSLARIACSIRTGRLPRADTANDRCWGKQRSGL